VVFRYREAANLEESWKKKVPNEKKTKFLGLMDKIQAVFYKIGSFMP